MEYKDMDKAERGIVSSMANASVLMFFYLRPDLYKGGCFDSDEKKRLHMYTGIVQAMGVVEVLRDMLPIGGFEYITICKKDIETAIMDNLYEEYIKETIRDEAMDDSLDVRKVYTEGWDKFKAGILEGSADYMDEMLYSHLAGNYINALYIGKGL